MKSNSRNKFWILIGIGVLLIILMIVLSSILTLGEHLRSIHEYVEYGFYVLSALLVYFLIINPVRIILFAPTFSVVTVLDKNSPKTKQTYKKVAKNLLNNNLVTGDEAQKLADAMKDTEKLRVEINKDIINSPKRRACLPTRVWRIPIKVLQWSVQFQATIYRLL